MIKHKCYGAGHPEASITFIKIGADICYGSRIVIGGSFHEVDVTDFEGTETVLNAAVDTLGGLHIAVTTAGRGIARRPGVSKRSTAHTRHYPHDFADLRPRSGLAYFGDPRFSGG